MGFLSMGLLALEVPSSIRLKLCKTNLRHTIPKNKTYIQTNLIEIKPQLQESYNSQEKFDEAKAVSAIKSNSNYFYSCARKINNVQSAIGPLIDNSGDYTTDPASMPKILSDQYKGVFSTTAEVDLDLNNIPTLCINDLTFEKTQIITAIDEVSSNSALARIDFRH